MAGRAFSGPVAGVSAGYEREIKGLYADTHHQIARYFLGATLGYDFVLRGRFIVAPAVSAEYGRPSTETVVKTWEVHPRIGFGFRFD